MSVKLGNLVYDWIQNDPELKPHFNVTLSGEGFFIETKCEGRFTLVWINDSYRVHAAPSLSWKPGTLLNPADPQYFNKIEKLCRDWHNAYGKMYQYSCKTKL